MKKILLLLLCFSVNIFSQSWWNNAWQSRLTVKVDRKKQEGFTSLKVEDTGRMKPDGSDFRAVDSMGNLLPIKVYPDSPEGVFLIAVKNGSLDSWMLYYNNPEAEPPASWTPEKGLLLATYGHSGKGSGTWDDFNALFQEKGVCFGRDFVKAVFHGSNPFGRSSNYLSVYSGKFYAEGNGSYLFSTVSDDASFLFVDGKMTVSWAGQHSVWGGQTGKFRKNIDLKKGMHLFRYCHIDYGGDQVAAAYIQRPGQKKLGVLWFPVPDPSKPVNAESRDGSYEPVVLIREAGEIDAGDRLRMVAVDCTASKGAEDYVWSVGDGNEYKGRSIRHLYLCEGKYPLTLKYREKGQEKSISMKRRITYTGARKNLRSDMDFLNIICGYDYSKAGKERYMEVLRFGVSTGGKLPEAFLKQADSFAFELSLEDCISLSESYILLKDYSKSLFYLDKGLEQFKKKEQRARLLVKKGDLYFYFLKNYPEAIRCYREVTRNPYLEGWGDFRLAFIRLGDVYRERKREGDFDLAFTYYRKAEDLNSEVHIAKSNGYYTQSVLELIGKRDYENALSILEQWEFNFPTEKLNGFSSLLRARINFNDGKYMEAEKQALNFIGINPTTTYIADYYMLIGAARYKQDNKTGALEYYQKVVDDCPESPKRDKAADLAGALRTELSGKK